MMMKARQELSANDASQSTGPRPDDGTRTLLKTGFWVFLVGAIAGVATLTVLGGVGVYGPHNNTGWIALILCMMNCPFGLMLLLLGGAKWTRNKRMQRHNR